MALLANHAPAAAEAAAAACFGPPPPPNQLAVCGWRRRRAQKGVVAMADLLGDFGARDPFPEEIESNFGEKVLGNVDTLHRILIPTLSVLSFARLPLDPNPALVDAADARLLLHKVVGWRLLDNADQGMRLQCIWKVRDEACGRELVARINAVVDGAPATVLLEAPNQVKAELQTPSAGSLTVNDFIVAARIDQVKTLDLIPKKRVWA
ncbi:hypothetical protein ABZP36_005277 [Zizania latifolia]